MSEREHQQFLSTWEFEAQKTAELLRALPPTQYDFRPDPQGRSLGELGWHLAEVDAYISYGIEQGRFAFDSKPPGIERPRAVAELAPGYERVHREAVARVRGLTPADYDRSLPFFDGTPLTIRQMLWGAMLHHLIHHRGQLTLLCRLAGGVPPGIYGPTREAMAKMAESSKRGA